MRSFTRTTCLMAFGLFAIIPQYAAAQTEELAKLQAQVDTYISADMTNEVDSMLSSYKAMKFGQTYSADSPIPPQSDNTNATWKKMSYSNASASQRIGYASDQCAAHTTYDQLVAKGVKVDKAKFDSVSDKFCKLVKAGAELYHRYEKYQFIKDNGVVLVKRSKSQGHDFKGIHRTFGGGLDLVYKPDIAGTLQKGVHPDQTFQYNSWIKWSDDNPTPLNIIKKIREMKNDSAGKCDGISIPIINGGSVRAYMYLNVVNVSSTTVTIKNCLKAVYNGGHGTHSFPDVTLTAPFGYLYELEVMKDDAKIKFMDKIKDKVSSMVGANTQMIELLKKIH